MVELKGKTALITGANSGLGFEAAAQLAKAGYGKVILACRTAEKGANARTELVAKTGLDPFAVLAMDVSQGASVDAAIEMLAASGEVVDAVILNAGLVAGSSIKRAENKVEITVAASLTGHHRFTMGLLNGKLLSDDARIVIAGSEAARGDVPGMKVTDLESFADEHHGGDRSKAIETIAYASSPYKYNNMSHYANSKVFVALWAKALAKRLPTGMMVNAVSPGSAPSTGVMRNQNWFMRIVMTVVMSGLGRLIGLYAPTSQASMRYLDALQYDESVNGGFFASVPGKMVGKVVEQSQPHIEDEQNQEALWHAVVNITSATLRPQLELAS